ncbi:MAG: hypothetical protein CFE42_20600 [Ralstonia sp. PBBBR1]|nr:MAG: hypothetical protein CFE42_20600 [Ralstonia sp. PBBBR1]
MVEHRSGLRKTVDDHVCYMQGAAYLRKMQVMSWRDRFVFVEFSGLHRVIGIKKIILNNFLMRVFT